MIVNVRNCTYHVDRTKFYWPCTNTLALELTPTIEKKITPNFTDSHAYSITLGKAQILFRPTSKSLGEGFQEGIAFGEHLTFPEALRNSSQNSFECISLIRGGFLDVKMSKIGKTEEAQFDNYTLAFYHHHTILSPALTEYANSHDISLSRNQNSYQSFSNR